MAAAVLLLRITAVQGGSSPMPSSGRATATHYDVGSPPRACNCHTGVNNYPSAAISEYWFGVGPNEGSGPVCGRCYNLTVVGDPYSPQNPVPAASPLFVKAVDLCPHQGNEQWCMATSQPNQFGYPGHFDVATPFANEWIQQTGVGAWVVEFAEVPCQDYAGFNDPSAYGTQTSSWGCCPQNPYPGQC